MMSNRWTLTLLIGGLLLTPAALAQEFGMDQQFNQSLSNQAMQAQAESSKAATGTQAFTTSDSAWADMAYIQGQKKAAYIPGILRAPTQQTQFGTVSTYKGNSAQFLKGASSALGASLPICQTGLNAVNGGYLGRACGQAGSGGFSGSGGGSRIYPFLPPTSTSTVDLNTAY